MKVVLDTNVLVAAFASHGLCEEVFEVCLTSHQIFVSKHILAELRRALERKVRLPAPRAIEILSFLCENASVVEPDQVPANACRDRTDLAVLGTAVSASADCLITGDKDLLDLRKYRGVPIVSPREFYTRL